MENTPPENPQPPELQFDTAEFNESTAVTMSCAACHGNVVGEYYEINGQHTCSVCRGRIEQVLAGGSRLGRILGATFLGCLAGVLGAAIYFGVAKLTGYEIGLVALVVGFLVGGGVRKGSGGRGGWFYQLLAMFLTYASISASYGIFAIAALAENPTEQSGSPIAASVASAPSTEIQSVEENPQDASESAEVPTTQALDSTTAVSSDPFADKTGGEILLTILMIIATVIGFILALPIMVGIESPIAFLIIGFGVYTAWKMNRRVLLNISGPYRIAAGVQPSASPPPPSISNIEPTVHE